MSQHPLASSPPRLPPAVPNAFPFAFSSPHLLAQGYPPSLPYFPLAGSAPISHANYYYTTNEGHNAHGSKTYKEKYDILEGLNQFPQENNTKHTLQEKLDILRCRVPVQTVLNWKRGRNIIYQAVASGYGWKKQLTKSEKEVMAKGRIAQLKKSLDDSFNDKDSVSEKPGGDEDPEEEEGKQEENSKQSALMVQLGESRTNAQLIYRVVVQTLKAERGDTLWDATSGERLFQSDQLRRHLTVFSSDFFKNYRDCDDEKYEDVLPPDKMDVKIESGVKIKFMCVDPPHNEINGGHTVNNCNMEKSLSRIKFNFTYGVWFKYNENMIALFYVKLLIKAKEALADDGYLLVKVQDLEKSPLVSKVEQWAGVLGFVREGLPQMIPKRGKSTKNSFLLVLRKSTSSSFGFLSFQPDASSMVSEMMSDLEEKVKSEYRERIEECLQSRQLWMQALQATVENLVAIGNFDSGVVAEILEDRFPELADQYRTVLESEESSAWEMKIDEGDVENAQRMAVEFHQLNLAVENVFGIIFVLLCELQKVTTVKGQQKLYEELGFHDDLITVLNRSKVGSECRAANVKTLEALFRKKRKAKKDAREDKRKQRKLTGYYGAQK